ncbi:hypothetical protein ACH5RR_015385 [Cinchona calisaya]|uniref:Transposase MuDR plant domain-containing protein n=1 Tax=Cinchona calisaya TaxID=153742 RepID=A0ABD2ZUU8_9GENT
MWEGRVKKYKDIDPDDMSRLELYELLKQLRIPINMPDMSIRYRDPSGQFILIQRPQNQNVGQQEVDAAELENLNVGTHVIEHNQVDSQIPKFEDPVIEQNENINVREEYQFINSSDSGSDAGDTLSDGCDFHDESDVTNGFENNIDLGEYTTYAELISDDYRKFLEARRQGKIVENDNPIRDHDILEATFNSSDDENREPFREFNEERDMMNPKIEIGLIFSTVHVYRKALRMYSILKGFELKFKKNDSNKVSAICRRKCGWKIYASYYRGTKAFQIKSIKGTPHRCPWSFKNMSANSRWLANNFRKELCDDPKWDLKGFKRTVRRRFKLHSSKYQIYKAKNHALAAIHGEHKEQFNRLRDYCASIMMKNPGSAAYVVSEVVVLNANPIFKRMFIIFGAQKDGFVQGCRPVIGLDACHLKDKFGGHLMHAVGRDGNK